MALARMQHDKTAGAALKPGLASISGDHGRDRSRHHGHDDGRDHDRSRGHGGSDASNLRRNVHGRANIANRRDHSGGSNSTAHSHRDMPKQN